MTRTRFDLLNRSRKVWVCGHCRRWHDTKVKRCVECQGQDVLYFASREEARRFGELALMLDHGIISDLEVQVAYPIVINEQIIATYYADFRYRDTDGKEVIEDSKPAHFRTEIFTLKSKLVNAIYGVTIKEVTT